MGTAELFKGLALFTPGGDVVYAIEPHHRDRWHLHLCVAVQEVLGLPEPPHFLVPCYSATVDRYLNPQSQRIETIAEIMFAVWRYRGLLNQLFELESISWELKPSSLELCNPLALESYRQQFPELWQNHDLVMQVGHHGHDPAILDPTDIDTSGYVFRLFIRGDSPNTEETLLRLHETLDRALGHPYTLKVIDVLKHPQQTELDRVSATPTLIRIWPQPIRRIVGEMDDLDFILKLINN
ncbi:circadian clock KaiB family protein [Geitlerinema sp. P-1104]|uniref:circadian clock KaiB family protein n=1 Tax=Geitlerinema sp. P-1104 TaxID=2546230 RepID=UPI001476E801|nr:circadian clock KaiB family protein [Geitlerinema sp. P-1104]